MLGVDKSTIVEAIKNAGVVGAGGAGFPTHVKAQGKVDCVIANGAECEPMLATDKTVMTLFPEKVVEGLRLMMLATGAPKGIICTKRKYTSVVAALTKATQPHPDLSLHLVDDFYPSGDEHVMVHEVTGRIVPEGGIPLDVGVVVSNVATLTDVEAAVNARRPVTERIVTVAGAVASPSIFRVPVGTPAHALLEATGGPINLEDGSPRDPSTMQLILGGPMMGQKIQSLDTPITKTTSGLLVIPKEHPLARRATLSSEVQAKRARSTCCGCRMCTDMCPRHLLGHNLEPHKVMRSFANMPADAAELTNAEWATQAFLCSQCNVCEAYACQMELSPRALYAEIKGKLGAAGIRNPHHKRPNQTVEAQAWSRTPLERLKRRLGVNNLPAPHPLTHEPLTISVGEVSIPLRQHVGVPAEPVVQPGDKVVVGQIIGTIPEGKLGANVHASMGGEVVSIAGGRVIIRA